MLGRTLRHLIRIAADVDVELLHRMRPWPVLRPANVANRAIQRLLPPVRTHRALATISRSARCSRRILQSPRPVRPPSRVLRLRRGSGRTASSAFCKARSRSAERSYRSEALRMRVLPRAAFRSASAAADSADCLACNCQLSLLQLLRRTVAASGHGTHGAMRKNHGTWLHADSPRNTKWLQLQASQPPVSPLWFVKCVSREILSCSAHAIRTILIPPGLISLHFVRPGRTRPSQGLKSLASPWHRHSSFARRSALFSATLLAAHEVPAHGIFTCTLSKAMSEGYFACIPESINPFCNFSSISALFW